MGDTTSSYDTAGIALRVSGALKPHHHGDKVGTPSVGKYRFYEYLNSKNNICKMIYNFVCVRLRK
jgi:hypothetical protein